MSNILSQYELDDIPKYIFQRYILQESINDKSLKKNILLSNLVKSITDQQFEDGSWDYFHTLSSDARTKLTTENAIRRLLILGLDINDEPMKKVYNYMDRFLQMEIDIRDRKEGLSDWKEVTELFAAAWMLELDRSSKIAGEVADKWALLISRSFSGDKFDINYYKEAFIDIFNTKPGKRVWNIESFHIVASITGRLEPEIEEKFINYIMNNDKGIYYIAKGKLVNLPSTFESRETSRFIYAHTLLSSYRSYQKRCGYVVDWLKDNRSEDGLWDMGTKVKDNVFFPYSNSWRKPVNRKIDASIAILKYLQKVGGL